MLLQGLQHGSMLCSLARLSLLSATGVGEHSALALVADSRHKLCSLSFVRCKPVKCAVSWQVACCRYSLSASASTMSAWYLQRVPGKSSLPKADSDWSRLQQASRAYEYIGA